MYTYKLRRDLAVRWETVNPVLDQGEPGYEFDTGKLKIGDGVTVWTALPYLVETEALQAHTVSIENPHAVTKAQVGLADVANTSDANKPISVLQQTALDLKLASDHVSVTNARAPTAHGHPQVDVAGLDTSLAAKADLVGGVIPTSQVPAIATGETVTVASQAEMLALTAAQVQPGDVAIRSDQSGRRWVLAAANPSLIGSWIALEVPDAVSSVNSQQGAVILGKADVGLANVDNTPDASKSISAPQQAALDLKLPSNHVSVTNARVPIVHKTSHAVGGIDAVTPANIGAPTVEEFRLYVQSRLEGLVTNGSGLLETNYNFSGFTFDSVETHGGGGSFLSQLVQQSSFSDEFIPLSPDNHYRLSGWGKSGDENGANFNAISKQYFGIAMYDIDQNGVTPAHATRYSGSTDTTLAAALNPGNTTITLTDATGWYVGPVAQSRKIAWWPYTNAKGYTYPNYTYTRKVTGSNTWAENAIAGNVITLAAPWTGPALPAGTAVRNSPDGGAAYRYIGLSGVSVPNVWTFYQGFIGGVSSPTNETSKFFMGSAYIRLLFLINYSSTGPNNIRWSEIQFTAQSDLKVTSPDGLTTRRLGINNTGAVVAVP